MRQIKHIQDYDKSRSILIRKLIDGNKFWSYDRESVLRNISDEDIIENTLIYLDIDDINILFRIYPTNDNGFAGQSLQRFEPVHSRLLFRCKESGFICEEN